MSADSYIPGTCNIGAGEIKRRQLVALVGFILSLVALAGFISQDATPEQRLGIFLPLMIMSIGWIQSRKKFCLAYGLMGTFNFGKLGQISKVADKESLAADRKTALGILFQATTLALVLTLVIYLLPLN